VLAHLAGALHQSKIPASPELTAASAGQRVDDDEGGPFPGDIRAALEGFLKVCDGDPFVLVGSLVEFGHAVPTEARAALAAGLAHGGPIEARGAAVLFLLDPDPVVRRAVAGALAGVASTLSPTEVRRLIAVRNWRPIDERTEVDAIIRKGRLLRPHRTGLPVVSRMRKALRIRSYAGASSRSSPRRSQVGAT
jgi:HEAT repeat protein